MEMFIKELLIKKIHTMRTLLFFRSTPIFLLVFFLFSWNCKSQEYGDQVQFDLSKMELNLDLNFPKELVLFEYDRPNQVEGELSDAIQQMIEDAMEIIDDNEGTSNIAIGVDIGNGKAVINSIRYFEFEKVVNKYDREESHSRAAFPIGTFMDLFEEKKCPRGMQSIGNCANNREEMPGCLGEHLHDFIAENIQGLYDCTQIMIRVGLFNTRICGGGCN